jgi:protein arginine kinase activator
MRCDICNINEATIHVQEINQGKKKTLNICTHCASEHNLSDKEIEGFNLAEILYNLSSQMLNDQPEESAKGDSPSLEHPDFTEGVAYLKCSCGWDTAKFRETGRLGCAECYKVFAPILRDALKSMHKGTFHIGKYPGTHIDENGKVAMKIMSLQKELDECVKREEYEKAATLRDQISKLRKGKKTTRKKKKSSSA